MYVIKYKLHKNLRIVCTSVVKYYFSQAHTAYLPQAHTVSSLNEQLYHNTNFPYRRSRIFGGQDQVLFRDSLKR